MIPDHQSEDRFYAFLKEQLSLEAQRLALDQKTI